MIIVLQRFIIRAYQPVCLLIDLLIDVHRFFVEESFARRSFCHAPSAAGPPPAALCRPAAGSARGRGTGSASRSRPPSPAPAAGGAFDEEVRGRGRRYWRGRRQGD